MRSLSGWGCLVALGALVGAGCSESGGQGPMGGAGGIPECLVAEDCNDDDECTIDTCTEGTCENPTADDGFFCEGGYCQGGECEPLTSLFPCTEEGILEAIAAGGGPHGFECAGAQTVTTTEEIIIGNDVILDGLGKLTIDGDDEHRVFSVNNVDAELRRLTVTGGAGDVGGGIRLLFGSSFTLASVAVTGNTATFNGGGIFAESVGTLTLTNSAVSGNTARGGGGGIMSYKRLTLTGSAISENSAGNDGGGVWTDPSVVLTLTNSAVSMNSVSDGNGGGVASGELIMTNSTVSGNSASTRGGGVICNDATVTGSTLSGNSANTAGGGLTALGTVILTNSTVSGNAATENGGGLLNLGDLTLVNVTVTGNSASDGGAVATSAPLSFKSTLIDGACAVIGSPPVVSNGYNLESPGDSCRFTEDDDQTEMSADDLKLGALADNGGPTQTHALGAGENVEFDGSVAIDVIPSASCDVNEDQRGARRPSGRGCDVGAFELQQ